MRIDDEKMAKLDLAHAFYSEYTINCLPLEIENKVNRLYDCVVEISKNKGIPVLEMIHRILCLADNGKVNDSDILSFNV